MEKRDALGSKYLNWSRQRRRILPRCLDTSRKMNETDPDEIFTDLYSIREDLDVMHEVISDECNSTIILYALPSIKKKIKLQAVLDQDLSVDDIIHPNHAKNSSRSLSAGIEASRS